MSPSLGLESLRWSFEQFHHCCNRQTLADQLVSSLYAVRQCRNKAANTSYFVGVENFFHEGDRERVEWNNGPSLVKQEGGAWTHGKDPRRF